MEKNDYAVEQALLSQRDLDTENAAFEEDEESGFEEQDGGGGITDTQTFHTVVGIVIALNTMLVVVEASMINNLQVKPYLEKLEFAFTMIYVLEVSLKLKEQGFKRFFCSRGYKWNVFDLVITVVGFADAIVTATGHSGAGASAARLFRVMRLMRLVRAMRFLKDMDTVLKMAGEATLQLGFVVLIVVFISGIVTTNMLWDASDPEVREKFAYLGRSMWTMYSLMTMDNWTEQVMQILHTKPAMCVFFILYIFIAAITLMSLTSAIFVQLNMFRREQEAEAKILHKKEAFIKRHATMMDELFKLTDVDRNERISMAEMERLIKDKPQMSELKDKAVLEEGMLRTVMLSIFDFWDQSSFEYEEKTREFSHKEFTTHIIDRLANPQAELLFCGVATRKLVHDLQMQVHEKINKLDESFRSEMARLCSIVQNKEGHWSRESHHEEELAIASLCASCPHLHSQEELRREDNHAPSRKEKHPLAVRQPPREKKQGKGEQHPGSARDHPIQRKPQSMHNNNPFLKEKTPAPELSSASFSPNSEPSTSSALEPPVLEMPKLKRHTSTGSQSTRDSASVQPRENEPKGHGDKQEERRGDVRNVKSMTSGWRNFYAGTNGQPQSAPVVSFNPTSSTKGRNKVGIQDENRTKASGSRDPPASAAAAAAASQKQQQPLIAYSL